MTTPEPPSEARLIAQLREAAIPPLSMREAARRAGMSPATWTHNEQGYRQVVPGVTIPVKATADKLARMALIVGATPEQLAGTSQRGREAAVILEKLIAAGPDPDEQLAEAVRVSRDISEADKRALIDIIRGTR